MASSAPPVKKLSSSKLMALSSLAFPLSGIGLPLGVYLSPYYADEVGLGVAMTGMLFMALRIFDLLIDPVIGGLIDRTHTRWGRARPWVVGCVPILMLAAWFVYMPPKEGVGPLYFIIWMAIFYVGSTMLLIARNAWVADVAVDYDDRSRHFVMIEAVSIVSMLVLLIMPVIVAIQNPEADRSAQIAAMGWCLIISLPLTAWLSCRFVPDRPEALVKDEHAISLPAVREALGNKLLMTVLWLEVCIGLAISVTSSLYLFVAESVFGLKDAEANLLLVVFFLSSVAGLPFWMALAKRTEKHKAICVAVLLMAVTYVFYFIVGQIGGFWPFAIAAITNGFGFTAALVIGRSMTADVIEWERARTGKNRAGLYYGLNAAFYKIGASFAIGAAYLLVGLWANYEAGQANSPEAVQRLLIVFCVLPAALYVIAYFVVRKFPLDRAMQQATADELSARSASEPAI